MSQSQPVTIRLLDREYTVGCEPDEREGLLSAARLLDNRMREIRGSNRMAALDRVAVLAALNLAHELQQLRDADDSLGHDVARTLEDLKRRVTDAIDGA